MSDVQQSTLEQAAARLDAIADGDRAAWRSLYNLVPDASFGPTGISVETMRVAAQLVRAMAALSLDEEPTPLNAIREIRESRGSSLYELGQMTGMKGSEIHKLETGVRILTREHVDKLAQALGVAPAEIGEPHA